jgi:acyl dehydratase
VISAEATVTNAREDKPVTTLATRITNQDGVAVLDGMAVVWRDPNVAAWVSADERTQEAAP